MSIALNQRERRPSAELLHCSESHSILNQSGCERMPCCVNRDTHEIGSLARFPKSSDRMIRFSIRLGKDKFTVSR